ncbi:MAG: DUF2314 domain-containing protein [Planctomycetota bacterium]
MVVPIVILAAALGVAISIGVMTRRRRQVEQRHVSIVGLTRMAIPLTSESIARAASRAWDADLGNGASEGIDGFVASVGNLHSIVHNGKMFLLHSFANPYDASPDENAQSLSDPRIRSLFLEHRGWFSCDAAGINCKSSPDESQAAYRQLARLFSELLDDACLLIYLPELKAAYPVNEKTLEALAGEDPVRALNETATVPAAETHGDTPPLVTAVTKARETWPLFVEAFESGLGSNFSIKAPVTVGGKTEFIWITVLGTEGDLIFGKLANHPVDLGHLKMGSRISARLQDLNDWIYTSPDGRAVGGHTIDALNKVRSRNRRG